MNLSNRIELDDLVQEGLIAVWLSLDRNVYPTKDHIRHKMLSYIDKVNRQIPNETYSL